MNNKVCNITFGGIGGQGVLKASEIMGWAAVYAGYHVKKSEVHGMAQRGGSVESHVRFGRTIYSPLVAEGCTDYLVSFHRDEHDRLSVFLKPGGIDLIEHLDDANKAIESPRYLNTFLVGVLSAKLDIKKDCWMKAIKTVFRKEFVAANKKVFLDGWRLGQK
ncbi:MAG: indolepyruvate oxidoreductase subunit beta [Anaerohalosphaera sp.]|nr:indolepyruvate oxidoreductase subunit beta [Anaerohalosphaera sp.]